MEINNAEQYFRLLSKVLTPFSLARLTNANIIWIDKQQYLPDSNSLIRNQSFLRDFAACVPCEAFSGAFKETAGLSAWAEPYGGAGVTGNGGGARVGVLSEYQVKGIGPNPLAGQYVDPFHSYGTLLADQGTSEVIFSLLAAKLLPIGSVSVIGLVDTGSTISFSDKDVASWRTGGRNVLMVRKNTLRPAHFMQALNFVPQTGSEPVCGDKERVCCVVRAAEAAYNDSNQQPLSRLFDDFISNAARQFAAARANRLIHGALSPSNLAVNGAWLDLSMMSVLPVGKNYRFGNETHSFLEESGGPLEVLKEWLHNVNKYSEYHYEFDMFESGYREMFRYHYFGELLKLVGVEVPPDIDAADEDTVAVANLLDAALCGDTRIYSLTHPIKNKDNPLLQVIINLYTRSDLTIDGPAAALRRTLMSQYAVTQGHDSIVFEHYRFARFLDCVRQAIFSTVFFRPHFDELVRGLSVSELGGFIVSAQEQISCIWSQGKLSNGWVVSLLNCIGVNLTIDCQKGIINYNKQRYELNATTIAFLRERLIERDLKWYGYNLYPKLELFFEIIEQFLIAFPWSNQDDVR